MNDCCTRKPDDREAACCCLPRLYGIDDSRVDFNVDRNGFNVCIIRIGGRVLIERAAFEHWLEAHRVATR
jgi:hypothetical protein